MEESGHYYTGKLFFISNQWYFFNTLSGTIDAVRQDTASVLSGFTNSHGGCDVPRANPNAKDMRPIIKNPYSRTEIEAVLDKRLRLLVLELTRSCNMACTYCIDGEAYDQKDCLGPSVNMSENTALRGVDYLLDHSSEQTQPLAISFYGGEPLLQFSLLKTVVKYAKKHSRQSGKDIVFSITTNGTLITRDIAEYLIKNSVQIVISHDGPEEVHNCYRHFKKGGRTYESVMSALEMIRDIDSVYFDRFVRCSVVVMPNSNLEELQNYFNNLDVNILANYVDTYGLDEIIVDSTQGCSGLETLKKKITEGFANEGADYLFKQSMSKNFSTMLLSPMIKRFLKSSASSKYKSLGQCILGASRLYLSADQYYYPCEKIAGHTYARIGTIEKGLDTEKIINTIEEFYEMAEGKCSGCWMSSHCSACLALACSGDHLSNNKYNHYCQGTKTWGKTALEMVASAKLHLHNKTN